MGWIGLDECSRTHPRVFDLKFDRGDWSWKSWPPREWGNGNGGEGQCAPGPAQHNHKSHPPRLHIESSFPELSTCKTTNFPGKLNSPKFEKRVGEFNLTQREMELISFNY